MSNMEKRQVNIQILNLATAIMRKEFTDSLVEDSANKLMNNSGNFTFEKIRAGNLVDRKLAETVGKINWMVEFGDIKRQDLSTLKPEDYYEHIKNSIVI